MHASHNSPSHRAQPARRDLLAPFRAILGDTLPPVLAWPPVPLAVGYARELVAKVPAGGGRRRLRQALKAWCASLAYRSALAREGAQRHDGDRHPVGPVSDEDAAMARRRIKRRPRPPGKKDRAPRHRR